MMVIGYFASISAEFGVILYVLRRMETLTSTGRRSKC